MNRLTNLVNAIFVYFLFLSASQAGPISVAPTSHDYGVVPVESTTFQTFDVSESGTGDNTILAVALTENSQYTIIADTCSFNTIDGPNACSIIVQFNPTDLGSSNSQLRIEGTASLATANLSGAGSTNASISITPGGIIDFGQVEIGQSSAAIDIQWTNIGTTPANIVSVGIDGAQGGEFDILSTTCGSTLDEGEDCHAQVIFRPTTVGAANDATLQIVLNDGGPPDVTIGSSLLGQGIAGPVSPGLLQIKANVLDFDLGIQQSLEQATTVTNVGGANVTINALTLEGDSNFSQSNDCAGKTLTSGETCSIAATFESGDEAGNFNAVVSIDSNPATLDFLVLLGSAQLDEGDIDDGGCSLGGAGNLAGSMMIWIGFPLAGLGIARMRRRE
jgi:hypothetical protein